MRHLFLDESGNHSLNAYEPSYPVFVLGGVLVDEDELARLAAAVREFKVGFFGHDRLVLHTADIARNRRGFERLADPGVRRRFYAELNALLEHLDFSIIACAIDKPLLVQRYGALAVDPYALSLGVVVERLCFALGASERGRIIVECRNRRLDRELRTSWDILRINGTRFVRPSTIARRIVSCDFHRKSEALSGLELSDLVVSPLGRLVARMGEGALRPRRRRSPRPPRSASIVTLCALFAPAYDGRMKILFLDESGDHSLSVIDAQYPVFVLGGVIVDADYAAKEMPAAVRRFKLEALGRPDVTLHTADIVRQQGAFAMLVDPGRRRAFRDGLNALIRRLDYTVIACAIRKDAHLAAYGAAALDPYTLSLNVLVERFCFALADTQETQPGVIVAERRDQALDSALLASWRHLRERGTAYLRPGAIRDRIAHLRLEGKGAGIAGLELADLVVSPIGRFVAGKQPREDWAIVESKLRRRKGDYLGAGLVILPKE